MHHWIKKIVIFLSIFALNSGVAYADCPLCKSQQAEIAKKEAENARLLKVKKLNEDYLKSHQVNTTMSIKINSNIMISSARSETMENEIQFLKTKNETDCVGCP